MIQLYLALMTAPSERDRWLLLIHQLPKEPAYLRVKIGRRLAQVGAISLKNSVYVLPKTESSTEDFQWVRREITEGGGEATVVDAQFVEGLSHQELEARFRAVKDSEYDGLAHQIRALPNLPPTRRKHPLSDDERAAALAEIARFERRLEETAATDFFGASGREVVAGILRDRRQRLIPASGNTATPAVLSVRGRTWVTRVGIGIDRIASAWLIQRFIDPDASFKFVPAKGYLPKEGELRFDMFEAEFSHEGDGCTFETLLRRFDVTAPGLGGIAEVVHDIDIKDAKFTRPETPGVAACIVGICSLGLDDEARLARGSVLFESLLAYFASKKDSP